MLCLKCGCELKRSDLYCPRCGARTGNTASMQQEKEFKMRTFDEEETSSNKSTVRKEATVSNTYNGPDNRNKRLIISAILLVCVFFLPVIGTGGLFPDYYPKGIGAVTELFDTIDSVSSRQGAGTLIGDLFLFGFVGVYLASVGVFIGALINKKGMEKAFSVAGAFGGTLVLLCLLLKVLSDDGSVFDFMEFLFDEKCPLAIGFWGAFGLYIASYVQADQ